MNTDDRKKKIRELLLEMSDYDLISVHNYYVVRNRYEEEIWNMNELVWFVQDREPMEIIEEFCVPEFNPNDRYFYWDRQNNVQSFDYLTDDKCPIEIRELVDFIDGGEDCNNDEIRDLLEKFEAEEEVK